MPSLEFNSVELLRVSYTASERAVADFESRPLALTLDSLVAAVFAAAAVEAFTNDLADHVEVWRAAAGDWAFNATTPELIRAVQEMIAIDAARGGDQLTGKVRAAGRALAGDPKLPDGRDLQDLRRLIIVRCNHTRPRSSAHAAAGTARGNGGSDTLRLDGPARGDKR